MSDNDTNPLPSAMIKRSAVLFAPVTTADDHHSHASADDDSDDDDFSLSSDSDNDNNNNNNNNNNEQKLLKINDINTSNNNKRNLDIHINNIINMSANYSSNKKEEEQQRLTIVAYANSSQQQQQQQEAEEEQQHQQQQQQAPPPTTTSIFQNIKSVIEQRFVKPYELKMNYMCGTERKSKLKLVVEWSAIESIVEKDLDTAENCIQTLQMALLWENLKKGVMRFIAEDAWQRQFFNDTVTCIVIDFSFSKDQKTDINLMAGMGILCYQINVSVSGDVLRPFKVYEPLKDRAEQIKKNFGEEMDDDSDDEDNSDFTETDEENILEEYEVEEIDEADEVIDDEDLVTGKLIEDLRRVAIHPSVSQRNSLEYLLRVLRSDNPYWKPNKHQKMIIYLVIEEIRKRMKSEKSEVVVKSWMVTKMNKNALRQERVFVLTDRRFYTAKIIVDKNKKYIIDNKHIKNCSLNRVFLIDVARFKPNPTETKFQPFAMALYAEKGSKRKGADAKFNSLPLSIESSPQLSSSPSSSNLHIEPSMDQSEELDESDHESEETSSLNSSPSSSNLNEKKPKKQKKAVKILNKVTKHAKKGAKKLLTHTDKPEESQNEDDLQLRPSTEGSSISYIMAPNDIHQSDNQQLFLLEISWCIFAAASARQGSNARVLRPFQNYRINKPRASAYSSIYNKFNLGATL